MRVCRGLDLPRAFMERHFREAVRIQPRVLLAYSEKAEYLLPRWHGNQEELLAFGKECLETGAWDEDIPQICLSTIRLACEDLDDDALASALKAGPIWDLLQTYYEGASKHRRGDVVDYTDNLFARLCVFGGHFEEAAPAFQKIEKARRNDFEVFVDDSEYEYFCDLVHVRTGKLPTRWDGRKRDKALAEASTALANDNLDDAEKALAQVEKGDAEKDRLVERYRGAVALGRKLKAEGAVTLSPQQVKDLCLLSSQELWTVEKDKLTGRKLTGLNSPQSAARPATRRRNRRLS